MRNKTKPSCALRSLTTVLHGILAPSDMSRKSQSKRTKGPSLEISISEKQNQVVMRTEVNEKSVARESGAERHVPEEPMRESEKTELGNSFSEKQNQAVMRTEVIDNGVTRESGAKRHVPEEEDWASEDSHSSFLILCFAWR